MNITIRLAKKSDLRNYTHLLQRTYQTCYIKPEIGLTPERFSKEIFNTKSTQTYLKSNLVISDSQKTWLAWDGDKLVGSITIIKNTRECELRGFYVAPEYQGKGIGKKLWDLARRFGGDAEVVLDLYSHNSRTIDIYKHWGFQIDKEKGTFTRHWPEWPEGLEAQCLYMHYTPKKS